MAYRNKNTTKIQMCPIRPINTRLDGISSIRMNTMKIRIVFLQKQQQ